jgi:hypothetical protein
VAVALRLKFATGLYVANEQSTRHTHYCLCVVCICVCVGV